MKKLFYLVIILVLLFIGLCLPGSISADSLYIDRYDVDIEVYEDATFDVAETISYRATGEYGYIQRDITLNDYDSIKKCKQDPSLQCGGFSYLEVLGVYDEKGNKLPRSAYEVSKINENNDERLRVFWEYAPNKRNFRNELFTWTVEYKIYGGLGFFDNYDLFYWDVFYEDRSYRIENASFSLNFPEDIEFESDDLKVYGGEYEYTWNYDNQELSLSAENLSPYENFTVLLEFPKGIVEQTFASLSLDLEPNDIRVFKDDKEVFYEGDAIVGIVPGEHEFRFEKSGYYTQTKKLEFEKGEEKKLDIELEMTTARKILKAALVATNACFCFLGIGFVFWTIFNYLRKGRDKGKKKSIYPKFKPPNGVSPVLMGSIKDEKVHLTDITATIINGAVRGYIKIEELSKKKFKLIKLENFKSKTATLRKETAYEGLDKSEVKILNEIFDDRDIVTTDDLKNKFYKKLKGIKDVVYEQMVQKDYFIKRPDKVRQKRRGVGVLLFITGIISIFVGIPFSIYTLAPSLIIGAIVTMIFAQFMPAKTELGTDIYQRAKGFRMFLHTAERYKVKKQLTPDLFEKYLPYAMVFGVEKQWAKNFKDIYITPPDWYEGGSWRTFNTIYLMNSLSSMNQSTSKVLASSPNSSSGSGWSGGGWSGGGGSSGGFSGGGGGGGGGGMG